LRFFPLPRYPLFCPFPMAPNTAMPPSIGVFSVFINRLSTFETPRVRSFCIPFDVAIHANPFFVCRRCPAFGSRFFAQWRLFTRSCRVSSRICFPFLGTFLFLSRVPGPRALSPRSNHFDSRSRHGSRSVCFRMFNAHQQVRIQIHYALFGPARLRSRCSSLCREKSIARTCAG
jgi:hypothetical protein